MEPWKFLSKLAYADLGNLAQVATAVIALFTLVALLVNLCFFWKQNSLTQTLNRPLCGIKDILLSVYAVPSTPDIPVIGIEAVIVNSGNDAARDVLLTYELNVLDATRSSKTVIVSKKANTDDGTWVLMPRHEVKTFVLYIQKKDFDEAVKGYEKVALLEMKLTYKNMEGKPMEYSSIYSITRLLTDKDMKVYEVSLRQSKLSEP